MSATPVPPTMTARALPASRRRHDAIGKAGEHGPQHDVGRRVDGASPAAPARRADGACGRRHGPRAHRVRGARRLRLRIPPAPPRRTAPHAAGGPRARRERGAARAAERARRAQDVALARERRDERAFGRDAEVLGLAQHARESRRHRQREEAPPEGGRVQPSPASAPRSTSRRRARASALAGGGSSHGSVAGSRELHARARAACGSRSTRWTPGVSCSRRPASSARDQSRTQRPGPSRPARPARWVGRRATDRAESQPVEAVPASKRAIRANPPSTTVVTPSTVSAVSATLVASTTRRRGPARSARLCSSSG